MSKKLIDRGWPLILLLCIAVRSDGASLTVAPVRLELSAARPYTVLRVTNNASESVTLHARAFRWSFDAKDDVLTATDEVILNPPMATMRPKAVQIIRIGLRSRMESSVEETYRIIVEEVPTSKAKVEGTQISTILKMSIPVFVTPRKAVAPRLEWTAHRDANGAVIISGANHGEAHVQIKRFAVSHLSNREKTQKIEEVVYLLPSQRREWTLKNPEFSAAEKLVVEALTDAKNTSETSTVDIN
ncbi:MAG TPA: fimbria/pilus periplasmic chaperone [Terriglobales bacterium]